MINKTKKLLALLSIIGACAAVSVFAQPTPSTPFAIHGYVFFEDGSECKNPGINITHLNSGGEWPAETNPSSNYYQLIFANGTEVNVTETLLFGVKSPDGSQSNITHRTVTSEDINKGGIFDFNITLEVSEVLPIFDTGESANPYPSTMGTHNGSITPNVTIYNVSKLYIYPCEGTGGHTEYVAFYYDPNRTEKITEGHWEGYAGDWHNISFPAFTMHATHTYYYIIRTDSYPQIHHTDELPAEEGRGIINCTSFVDANGKKHDNWIPAIRLVGEGNVWSEDIRITNDTAYSTSPEIAVDSDDNIHITWRDSSGIYYTKLDNNGTTLVDDKKLSTGDLSEIAVDSNNNVHITWQDLGICYMKLDSNGSMLVNKEISTTGSEPVIAVDSNNNIHITWSDVGDDIYYTKLDNNGNTLIGAKGITTDSILPHGPAIAVDPFDYIHIAWCDCRDQGNIEIYYNIVDTAGNPEFEDTGISNDQAPPGRPKIAVDSYQNAHITWCDVSPPFQTSHGTQKYSEYVHYTKWCIDFPVIDNKIISTGIYSAIATDSVNNIHLTWVDNRDGNDEIYYILLDSFGNTLIDNTKLTTGYSPAIAVDSNNKAHVTWHDYREGYSEIYYKRQR